MNEKEMATVAATLAAGILASGGGGRGVEPKDAVHTWSEVLNELRKHFRAETERKAALPNSEL